MIIKGFCHPPRSADKLAASVMLLSEGRLQLSTAQGHQVLLLETVNINEPLGDCQLGFLFLMVHSLYLMTPCCWKGY
ncbi:hypothetical protein [Photobacterium sanguinicancri]|uniref:hypothetical protein n=1 Tax=Photobacterium sanguinicancri TaxID=875932 RepID=UPI00078795DE|nr:hypothetical protein [Photobacterium sanguinicancri]KXI21566.1 hypothetical protein AS132_20055 [Photobacterium sanguinicancri]